MNGQHHYKVAIKWTGNKGTGTDNYKTYERSYDISIQNKPDIQGSSDPAFRGDMTKHNPEELLVSSISACHMLWYLHLCAEAGVIVVDYTDNATGLMLEDSEGSARFTEVTLNPIVVVTDKSMVDMANELHKKANELCFIAKSVNFPIKHKVTTKH
ncbi:MAG: OsmC family protein [Sphingobacteriaceae bacterium]